ncbi:MAG TPA: CcmD family protein [Thermoanaerobaculia bacterium]|jgi:CcmD family protein
MLDAAPEGVVAGGWSYAIAAYVITALGLSVYAWSLASRLKKANREENKP